MAANKKEIQTLTPEDEAAEIERPEIEFNRRRTMARGRVQRGKGNREK